MEELLRFESVILRRHANVAEGGYDNDGGEPPWIGLFFPPPEILTSIASIQSLLLADDASPVLINLSIIKLMELFCYNYNSIYAQTLICRVFESLSARHWQAVSNPDQLVDQLMALIDKRYMRLSSAAIVSVADPGHLNAVSLLGHLSPLTTSRLDVLYPLVRLISSAPASSSLRLAAWLTMESCLRQPSGQAVRICHPFICQLIKYPGPEYAELRIRLVKSLISFRRDPEAVDRARESCRWLIDFIFTNSGSCFGGESAELHSAALRTLTLLNLSDPVVSQQHWDWLIAHLFTLLSSNYTRHVLTVLQCISFMLKRSAMLQLDCEQIKNILLTAASSAAAVGDGLLRRPLLSAAYLMVKYHPILAEDQVSIIGDTCRRLFTRCVLSWDCALLTLMVLLRLRTPSTVSIDEYWSVCLQSILQSFLRSYPDYHDDDDDEKEHGEKDFDDENDGKGSASSKALVQSIDFNFYAHHPLFVEFKSAIALSCANNNSNTNYNCSGMLRLINEHLFPSTLTSTKRPLRSINRQPSEQALLLVGINWFSAILSAASITADSSLLGNDGGLLSQVQIIQDRFHQYPSENALIAFMNLANQLRSINSAVFEQSCQILVANIITALDGDKWIIYRRAMQAFSMGLFEVSLELMSTHLLATKQAELPMRQTAWLKLLGCLCKAESSMNSSESSSFYSQASHHLRDCGRREELPALRNLLHLRRHYFTLCDQLANCSRVTMDIDSDNPQTASNMNIQYEEITVDLSALNEIAGDFCKLAEAFYLAGNGGSGQRRNAITRRIMHSFACQSLCMALIAAKFYSLKPENDNSESELLMMTLGRRIAALYGQCYIATNTAIRATFNNIRRLCAMSAAQDLRKMVSIVNYGRYTIPLPLEYFSGKQ